MDECLPLKEGDKCDYCRKGRMVLLPKRSSRLTDRPLSLKLEELTDLQCDNCGHVHLQEQNEEYSKRCVAEA